MKTKTKTLITKRDYEEWSNRLSTAVANRKAHKDLSGEGLLSLFGLAPDAPDKPRETGKARVQTVGQYAS